MSGFKAKARELLSAAKSGDPTQNLKRGVDAETLWPNSLDKEAEKAASILRSFFVDGFIVPYRTSSSCPQEIVRTSQGLAVFHVLREDLSSQAAGGSGVVVARSAAGQWSGPAGVLVDFVLEKTSELEVIDVVLVFRDKIGLEAISNDELFLGKIARCAPGPLPKSDAGAAGFSTKGSDASVWIYAKSKGHLVGLDFTGLRIRQAQDENDQYYGVSGVSANEILSGQAKGPSGAATTLRITLKALDIQSGDYSGFAASGSCPGDRRVRKADSTNGTS